ncbi:MAG: SDR family oxidoreductase [Alphaproteobacteria bacterium]|jgi:citronellol/citronellal dehydrogenase|nr:SDR family oxidoreductase [Alphaproteobacteria bacterium]MDP6564235.1 SDR family oxidoreductase [Alphaproteobacteria bacterium]MDP6814007.1 SDR family oxidoreductase [Alphaproteobacteria bacterium]
MSKATDDEGFGWSDQELADYPLVYRPDLFAGRTVLVSGAGSGLGKAIAFTFARLGARLVVCGRNPEKLENAKAGIEALGADCESHQITIRDPEQVSAMIAGVFERHGNLDVLVNNAGGQFPQPSIDFTVKGWNAVIDTNLNGTWYMMQSAARLWRDTEQPGSIVNIVADVWRGLPDLAHTCAARAGVIYLSKTVAVEWAPLNIRVNCVAPGCCETEAFALYPPEAAANYEVSNPLLHSGDPMDIAEAVIYIAGSSGKFVNGEVLTVDGGQQLWGDVWAFHKPDWTKVD